MKLNSLSIKMVSLKLAGGYLRKNNLCRNHHLIRIARNPYLVILFVTILLGFYLRLKNLGQTPFWGDEAHQVWAAKNFVMGLGFSDPIGPSSPYLRAWLTTTLPIVASFKIFGINEFAARLPTAVFGTALVAVSYLFGSKFLNRPAGLMLALFVALDPFLLSWSREARMYTHLELLYMLSILLFYLWYEKDGLNLKSKNLALLLIVSFLGYKTHPAYIGFFAVVFLFLIIVLLYAFLANQFETRSLKESVLVRAKVLVLFLFLCGLVFYLMKGLPIHIELPTSAWYPERSVYYYVSFLKSDYSYIYPLFFLGLVYLIFKGEKGWLIILAFLVPFLVASIDARKVDRYILHLIPLFALIGFSTVSRFILFIEDKFNAILRKTRSFSQCKISGEALSVLVVILVVLSVCPLSQTFEVAEDPPHRKRADWPEALSWVQSQMDDDDAIISTAPILSKWYLGKTDFGFGQKNRCGEITDTRTGAKILSDSLMVKQVIDTYESGWFIAGLRFNSEYHTVPEAREMVRKNTIEIRGNSWENIKVYHWNSELNKKLYK